MINRASVQLWGKAGQSAGPPKSAGKKSDRRRDRHSGGTDPILSTQRIPRSRDRDFIHTNVAEAIARMYGLENRGRSNWTHYRRIESFIYSTQKIRAANT